MFGITIAYIERYDRHMAGRTILLCEYGSTAHGTNTEFSDRDYMGIAIEPIEAVLGLDKVDAEQIKTAAKGQRSTSADSDTTIYPLRKWAALAEHGNPTVLTPLFVEKYETLTSAGAALLADKGAFLSQQAGHRFLGYMRSQRDAMTGVKNKRTNRPELIHQFGYDTKFAYHMIRLGMLGVELMQTGKMSLPMSGGERDTLLDIRAGKLDRQQVLDYSYELDAVLARATVASDLRPEPDRRAINKLLLKLQLDAWGH